MSAEAGNSRCDSSSTRKRWGWSWVSPRRRPISYSEREPETGLARKTSQVTCAWMNDQTSARKGFKDGERNTKPLLKSLHQVTTAVFGDRNPNSAS
jgi:hypothetical protein